MNWSELFEMQRKLDTYIQTNHQLNVNELFDKKVLALLVEVGELANETRCFKFWSTKPASDKSVILEEYIDGLHFILSIGLDKQYTYDSQSYIGSKPEITDQFTNVFEKIIAFKQDDSKERYNYLFNCYLVLGNALGFSEQSMKEAYNDKNKVNFKRQNEGY